MFARVLAITAVVLGSLFVVPKADAQRGRDSVECRSNDYRYTRCDVPWRDARLARQISGSQCVRGQTWGIDRRGIWVDRGCAGVFVESGGGGGGWGGGGSSSGGDSWGGFGGGGDFGGGGSSDSW
ncbi:MAG TPA: DUF3011 domain-containing protein [Tahibacter sp.]|nr:DUF3011 domain-containing protein [Tahibacter sp.]